jgi:hypothetical protein
MSEASEWAWQGFFGPMADAQAAWASVTLGADVGVLVPLEGGPMPVDLGGVMGMFAAQTRASAPMATPAGMMQADPAMVGRLVGA